jgi:thioredoxin 1
MSDDKELQVIREKKLRELTERTHSRPGGEGVKRHLSSSSSAKPIDISDETFSSTIQGPGVVVVDCWAPWCGPCRFLSPIVEELAKDYAGRISFGKLNVDDNPNVAAQYDIMSIPTLLIFKDGKLVDKLIGAMPRQMLEPRITRHI